jgi:hypothetical protein
MARSLRNRPDGSAAGYPGLEERVGALPRHVGDDAEGEKGCGPATDSAVESIWPSPSSIRVAMEVP